MHKRRPEKLKKQQKLKVASSTLDRSFSFSIVSDFLCNEMLNVWEKSQKVSVLEVIRVQAWNVIWIAINKLSCNNPLKIAFVVIVAKPPLKLNFPKDLSKISPLDAGSSKPALSYLLHGSYKKSSKV